MDDEGFHLRIENEPYIPLVVESHNLGEHREIYLTHYIEVGRDKELVHDGELVFTANADGQLRFKETAVQNPLMGGELRGPDRSFAGMFAKNILDQGFAEAALQQQQAVSQPIESSDSVDATQIEGQPDLSRGSGRLEARLIHSDDYGPDEFIVSRRVDELFVADAADSDSWRVGIQGMAGVTSNQAEFVEAAKALSQVATDKAFEEGVSLLLKPDNLTVEKLGAIAIGLSNHIDESVSSPDAQVETLQTPESEPPSGSAEDYVVEFLNTVDLYDSVVAGERISASIVGREQAPLWIESAGQDNVAWLALTQYVGEKDDANIAFELLLKVDNADFKLVTLKTRNPEGDGLLTLNGDQGSLYAATYTQELLDQGFDPSTIQHYSDPAIEDLASPDSTTSTATPDVASPPNNILLSQVLQELAEVHADGAISNRIEMSVVRNLPSMLNLVRPLQDEVLNSLSRSHQIEMGNFQDLGDRSEADSDSRIIQADRAHPSSVSIYNQFEKHSDSAVKKHLNPIVSELEILHEGTDEIPVSQYLKLESLQFRLRHFPESNRAFHASSMLTTLQRMGGLTIVDSNTGEPYRGDRSNIPASDVTIKLIPRHRDVEQRLAEARSNSSQCKCPLRLRLN